MDRKEAIDIVRKNWPNGRHQLSEALETLIPELKESEDERIRKWIKKELESKYVVDSIVNNVMADKALAWLKKQGEHIKFLESIQIGDEETRNPDGVLVNLSQLKRMTEKGEQNSITFNDAHIIDSALNDYCCKQYSALHKENGGVLSFARLQHLAMDIYGWCEKHGSQNLANSAKTCNVEPKFKVGDKICPKGSMAEFTIESIDVENYYGKGWRLSIGAEDDYELVEVKTCKDEQNPTDEVEPKFKAGNWYLCVKDFYGKGVRFDKGRTYYCGLNGCLQEFDSGAHIDIDERLYDHFNLWTIQDAKDGDVLYSKKGGGVESIHLVSSWKKVDGENTLCSVCTYRIEDDEIITGGLGAIWWHGVQDPFCPATKEQRDLLFQKMREAGYEWDAEKKELKKVEQNPAWSEEDDINLGKAIWYVENPAPMIVKDSMLVDWLKSLKSRVQPLPQQEWSEEDNNALKVITQVFEVNGVKLLHYPGFVHWLKTLPNRITPQNTWKPSESDILLLESIANGKSNPQDYQASLGGLIWQLKILRGE